MVKVSFLCKYLMKNILMKCCCIVNNNLTILCYSHNYRGKVFHLKVILSCRKTKDLFSTQLCMEICCFKTETFY